MTAVFYGGLNTTDSEEDTICIGQAPIQESEKTVHHKS